MRKALVFTLGLFCACCGLKAQTQPWWQRETAMTADGRLSFLEKSWWPRAKVLKEGEQFELDLNGDGKPDTTIWRQDGDIVEAIDDTGHANDIRNHVSTTYVVSFGGTGLVDRMVSYIDSQHRGKADEVELRYFRDGYLRYAWFAKSFGGDAATIFALKHWQYAGNDRGSEFRGNSQIYINKYDPVHRAWLPLSECPFSFWDLDGDGRTDVTLRVSAAPRGSLHGPDTDYANNYDYMWAKEATPLEKMGALNMRLSFNLDGVGRKDPLDKPHSTFSFTMTGDQLYSYAEMRDFNTLRRSPQVTVHMPWTQKWSAATTYSASATGFTWDEARSNFRWEGQFWIYEREYLSNTGSPTQRWNMRREFTDNEQQHRELYFSGADEKFHLKGAREGWLEAGHLVSDDKDLEFRWWDSKGDGYLDIVEVFRGDATKPSRTAHFRPQAMPVRLDPASLAIKYQDAMAKAIHEDESLIDALQKVVSNSLAEKYRKASQAADSVERKRYCLDIARELLYLDVRDLVEKAQSQNPYSTAHVDAKQFRNPSPGDVKTGYTLGDSLRYWESVRTLHAMDEAYANGEFDKVQTYLNRIDHDGEVRINEY
jgi:hypothetical protein